MAANRMATRVATSEWIIGQWRSELPQNTLPTKLDVLKTFCYYHNSFKKTISESAKITSDKLIVVWNKARIHTSFETFIVLKIKKMFIEYLKLEKNKNSKKVFQKIKLEKFKKVMSLLFDISHQRK